jgi:hypothetical protein
MEAEQAHPHIVVPEGVTVGMIDQFADLILEFVPKRLKPFPFGIVMSKSAVTLATAPNVTRNSPVKVPGATD